MAKTTKKSMSRPLHLTAARSHGCWTPKLRTLISAGRREIVEVIADSSHTNEEEFISMMAEVSGDRTQSSCSREQADRWEDDCVRRIQ